MSGRIRANSLKSFCSEALNFYEALFEIRPSAVDFSGALSGGGEDGDAARDGVHEDAGEAVVIDLFQSAEDRREVQLAAAGHL